ncbi:MAG TPA: snapalysin [Streptomyces sp.]|jgi:snapalysin|nr:snapalysin [Streptomyces sp.]
MKHRRTVLSAAVGFGMAASLFAAPVAVAAPQQAAGGSVTAGYTAGDRAQQNDTQKFVDAIAKIAAKKQAAKPGFQAVTITYSDNQAPSFQSQISQSTSIWNGSVNNVTLAEVSSGGDFYYTEGNDSRGSYASTDGHGHGYIFLDYQQNQTYDSVRVVAHETGHVLGLPDHYSGPCSELMSGGGPGPSCTNRYPDANESATVEQLWANGLTD